MNQSATYLDITITEDIDQYATYLDINMIENMNLCCKATLKSLPA